MTAGQTGSGKTVLNMTLLFKETRLLVYDNKDSLSKWKLDYPDNYTRDKIREGESFRVRIPDNDEFLSFAAYAYKHENCTIYIDEVNALIPPRKNTPQIILDIWQRGREKRVSGWAASQRPVSIPILFLTEAEHFFIFRLNNEADRKRLAGYTDKRVETKVPDQYGFYYYNVIDDRIRYINKLPI